MSLTLTPEPQRVKAEFPSAFRPLREPARYKIFHGGRGAAKSWAFARALLIEGSRRPLRIICAREFQNSIDESVHQLLSDQIFELGLTAFYDVKATEIIGLNGTSFAFYGLRRNINSLKSFEGADIIWVEEATDVSKRSWEVLIPTIRKEGSEIWVSFNPELDTDETYKRFVTNPPPGAVVVEVNWRDNPWFPAVLEQERLTLQARDPDGYLTIWEGKCRQTLDGAVFANEIRSATAESRICRVPWEAAKPVDTYWDLGKSDNTAIWFMQIVGFEFRVIDYYQNHGQNLSHYVKALRDRPYGYRNTWLPHDAKHDLLASELTIEQQMRNHGFTVKIAPQVTVAAGIEAARTVFPKCYFDAEKTSDGLQCLRHYQYERKDDGMSFTKQPLHNWASHGADAFRYLAVAAREDKKVFPQKPVPHRPQPQGWLGR
jgi:phage terminase large subunit